MLWIIKIMHIYTWMVCTLGTLGFMLWLNFQLHALNPAWNIEQHTSTLTYSALSSYLIQISCCPCSVSSNLNELRMYCAFLYKVFENMCVHSDVIANVNQNGWNANPHHVCVLYHARSDLAWAIVVVLWLDDVLLLSNLAWQHTTLIVSFICAGIDYRCKFWRLEKDWGPLWQDQKLW